MLKEAKDTQGIHSGGSSNDNMASDFSTPQFHASNDVCWHCLICENNYSLICSSLVNKSREWSIYVQHHCFGTLV